jgi:TolB-like protein
VRALLLNSEGLGKEGGETSALVHTSKQEVEDNSVAVIDFSNITGVQAVDWLSGGIADSVTVDLQEISSLKVVSRERIPKVLAQFREQKLAEKQIIDLGSSLGLRWLVWSGFMSKKEISNLHLNFF